MAGEEPALRFSWVATLAARTSDGRDARVVARSAETFANPVAAESDARSRSWSLSGGSLRCDGSVVAALVLRPGDAEMSEIADSAEPELVSTGLEASVRR